MDLYAAADRERYVAEPPKLRVGPSARRSSAPRQGRARGVLAAAGGQDPGGRAAERRLRAQPADPQPRGRPGRARPVRVLGCEPDIVETAALAHASGPAVRPPVSRCSRRSPRTVVASKARPGVPAARLGWRRRPSRSTGRLGSPHEGLARGLHEVPVAADRRAAISSASTTTTAPSSTWSGYRPTAAAGAWRRR